MGLGSATVSGGRNSKEKTRHRRALSPSSMYVSCGLMSLTMCAGEDVVFFPPRGRKAISSVLTTAENQVRNPAV